MWWTVELFESWIVGVFSFKVYYIASPSPVQKKKKTVYTCICVLTFSLKYQIQIMGWGKVMGEVSFIHSTHRTWKGCTLLVQANVLHW